MIRITKCLIPAFIGLLLFGCSADKVLNDSVPAPTDSSMDSASSLELVMTQLINEARGQSRTCGEYGDFSATTPVSWNTQLFEAASGHSQDMITNNFFSHSGSDGLEVGDRIRSTGYVASAWGENISAGRTSAKEVIDAWLDSPGHCANIMNPVFTEIGAATASDENTDFTTYWTLDLAAPR